MQQTWLDRFDWPRMRPWFFLVAGTGMTIRGVVKVRAGSGWWLILDWAFLALGIAVAVGASHEIWTSQRKRRAGGESDAAP